MIANIKASFVWLWQTHIQKTMAYLSGGLLTLDIAGLSGPIKAFLGEKGFNAVLLATSILVAIRAHAKPPEPTAAPPPIP